MKLYIFTLFTILLNSALAKHYKFSSTFYGCPDECETEEDPKCENGIPSNNLFVALHPNYFEEMENGNYKYCDKYAIVMPLDIEKAEGEFKLVKGKVIDQCGSCGETQIDLSQTAFEKLAKKKTGVLPIVWTIISKTGKIYVKNKYEEDDLRKLSKTLGLSESYILESYSTVAKYMATHNINEIEQWPWDYIKKYQESKTTTTSKKTTTSKYTSANREIVYNTSTRRTTTTTRKTTTTTTRRTTTTTTTRTTTTTTTRTTTTTTTTKRPITYTTTTKRPITYTTTTKRPITYTTTTKRPIITTTTTTKRPIIVTSTTTKKLVNSTPANYVVNEDNVISGNNIEVPQNYVVNESNVISGNNIEVPVNYLVSENSVVNNLINDNNQRKSPHTPTGIVKIQTSSIKTTTTTKMIVSTTTTTTENIEPVYTTTERAIPTSVITTTTTTTTVTTIPTVSSTQGPINNEAVNNDVYANVNANANPNVNANDNLNVNTNVNPNINADANPTVDANQQNVYSPPEPVNYGAVNNGANANPNMYTNTPITVYPPPTNQPIQYQQANQNQDSDKKIDSAVEGKEGKSVGSAIPVVFGGLFAASVGIFVFVKRAQVSKITSRVANGVTRTLSRNRRPQNRMMHQHGSDYNLPNYY